MTNTKLFRLVLCCLMLSALFLAVGCSDDDDDDPTGGETPSVDDALVTVWRAVGVTIDGEDVDLDEFFEFSEDAVAFHLTIEDDTSYLGQELDGETPPNVLYYEEGTAVSSGNTLTLTVTAEDGVDLPEPEVVAVGTWEVEGFTLTFAMIEDGQTIVITWTNWLA